MQTVFSLTEIAAVVRTPATAAIWLLSDNKFHTLVSLNNWALEF